MRFFACIMLVVLSGVNALAQFNVGFALNNDIKVVKGTDTIALAWAGGMNNPQFSAMPLSGEPNDILFVFDRDGALIKAFRYSNSTHKMEWVPYHDSIAFERFFPKLTNGGWCLLRDYNGDGKPDIFTRESDRYIAVYTNIGDDFPDFEQTVTQLKVKTSDGFNPIALGGNTIPAILDLNNDGDLDIVLFAPSLKGMQAFCPSFATLTNMGIDDEGSADSLIFVLDNKCWGKVKVGGGVFKPFDCETETCVPGLRDVSTTQAMHDLNGDGKFDMLVINDHQNALFAMYNKGTNTDGEIDLDLNDTNFPSYNTPVELANQPYPYFLDVDHDGDDDMLIGANHLSTYNSWEYDTSGTVITDLFYRNNGSDASPVFELEKPGYLSSEMIDVGIRSFPAFGDLTGDSVPDLIIGNSGYSVFNPDLSPAFITYYKNLGSKGKPVFKPVNTDFAEASLLNLYIAHPTLGDLEGDGDLDLVVGDGHGYIHIYKNTGTSTAPYFELHESKYKNIKLTGEAHPQLFDMNRDGKPDLIMGDNNGRIHYFENTGAAGAFDFSQNPTIKNLGGIDLLNTRKGMTSPYFTRNLDSTNNLYLFVGTETGIINAYGPIDKFNSSYTLADSIVVNATQTTVTGLDLFGDKRDELCIGQRAGGLYLLNRTNNIPLGLAESARVPRNINLYPNPAQGTTTLEMCASASQADLRITDLQGRTVYAKQVNATKSHYTEIIDLRGHSGGVYLVTVIENNAVSWAKFVLE